MKKLVNILCAGLGVMALTACSEFLDSNPLTSLVDSNFYQTESDADLAIVGCYDGVQVICSDGVGFWVDQLLKSDECFAGLGNGDETNYKMIDEYDKGVYGSYAEVYAKNWELCYKAVYRCNMLLSKMDQITWTTEGKRERIEAEARFLRAYTYWQMVRLWQNIPLVLKPLLPSEANEEQAPVADVFKAIEEDLLFACDNAYLKGEKWTASWAAANDGRVTVFAAKALLARVFLYYTGLYDAQTLPGGTDKATVTEKLKDCLEANSGHALLPEFKNLWIAASSYLDATAEESYGIATTYAGEGNCETVWAIKYNSTGDYNGNTDGNVPLKMIGLRNGQVKNFGGTALGDDSWGCGTIPTTFINDWKNDPDYAGDLRYSASVIDAAAEGIVLVDKHSQMENTGYWPKKYHSVGNGTSGLPTLLVGDSKIAEWQVAPYTDQLIVRYADVLLMMSELTGEVSYMNEVRARAGLAPYAAYSVENLRKERKYELAFEGHRFGDLLRYDSSLDYAAQAVDGEWTVENAYDNSEGRKVVSGDKLKATKGFSPIPQTQIDLSNGVLVQNEGWK